MMRVLLLSPVGQIGGAERVLLTLIAAVQRRRGDVEMHLISLAQGPLCDDARALGLPVTVLGAGDTILSLGDSGLERTGALGFALHATRALPELRRLKRGLSAQIDRLRPDVVHSNGLKTHLLTGLAGRAARSAGARVIWHVHDFVSQRPVARQVLGRFGRGVTAIGVSEAVGRDLAQWLPRAAVRVVLNGIDTARFSPGARGDAIDELAGWPVREDAIRVGLIATYARWKGQDAFLHAAARVLERADHESERERLRFYLVGGPIYSTPGSQFSAEELRGIAESLGIADRVAMIPFQADPAPIYRGLDAIVHASTRPEPFGLTIAEAMACARPVIVSAIGGAVELVKDGENGMAVPPGDVAGLAEAILKVAHDEGLRHSLGQRARAAAVERFDADRFAREMLQAYESAETP